MEIENNQEFSTKIAQEYLNANDFNKFEKYIIFHKSNQEEKSENKNIINQFLRKNLLEKFNDAIKNNDYKIAIITIKNIIQFIEKKFFDNEKFWTDAGFCFREAKQYDTAINCYLNALKLKKINPDNYRLIGDILYFDKNEMEKAIKFYEKYSEYIKNNANLYNVLGHLYQTVYKSEFVDKQIKYFEKAHKLNPNEIEFTRNLALVAGRNNLTEKFVKYSEELISKNPTKNDYFNYGCWGLKNKLFKTTHKYLINRFYREENPTPYPNINEKLWNGKTDLTNKTLLVRYEQGFGDTIMFSRFLPELQNRLSNTKIIFQVQEQLLSLITDNFQNITIIPNTDEYNNEKYDYQIPLMELFSILEITEENICPKDKYLYVEENKIKEFAKENINTDKYKVGLSFKGNPNFTGDNRDIPIEYLLKLIEIPNIQIYSLQVDNKAELFIDERSKKIIDLSSYLSNFEQTACAIENMDLIISTDNVILNLAGALNKQTFGLFNYYADYRWYALPEKQSGWYKSIKIYQAHQYNNWSKSFKKLYEDIFKIVSNKFI